MENNLSRRAFIGGTAMAAGAAAACLPEVAMAEEETSDVNASVDADVVIVGASIGGLLTAAYLIDAGRSVIVVEAASETGGTALISSGGVLRIFATWEETLNNYPDLEGMVLPKAFFENFESATTFVREKVFPEVAPISNMLHGWDDDAFSFFIGGLYEQRREYCDKFDVFIESNGGTIMRNTRAFELLRNSDGKVDGVRASGPDGEVELRSRAVVISTGGFQANAEMLVRYYGRYADNAVCRATPYNDGTGIEMGLAAGGKLSKGMASCYGHEVPAWPRIGYHTFEDPVGSIDAYESANKDDIRDLFSTQNSFDGIVVHLNLNGKRFFDEGFGALQLTGMYSMSSYMNNAAILEQPYATAISVFDSKTLAAEGGGYSAGVEVALEDIREAGGTIIQADSLEELFVKLNTALPLVHQIPVSTAVATIEEYNEAVKGGSDALLSLDPPRTDTGVEPIETAPFFAIPVTAGVSATQGGLVIDETCAVIGKGTFRRIPGLYAIPLAAGGAYYQNYIASALGTLVGYGYMAGVAINDYLG